MGLLVAIPDRHMIAVHEVIGPGVAAAMNGMVSLAAGQCEGKPRALSPALFYLAPDSRGQQVTQRSDGEIRVLISGPVADAFAALGAHGRAERVSPREPPPPGSWEVREVNPRSARAASLHRWVDIMADAPPREAMARSPRSMDSQRLAAPSEQPRAWTSAQAQRRSLPRR